MLQPVCVLGGRHPQGASAQAFVVRSGKAEKLETPAGYAQSIAEAISDAGVVVGHAAKGKGPGRKQRACLVSLD